MIRGILDVSNHEEFLKHEISKLKDKIKFSKNKIKNNIFPERNKRILKKRQKYLCELNKLLEEKLSGKQVKDSE